MRHQPTNEYRVRYRRIMCAREQRRVFQRRCYAERFVQRLIDSSTGPGHGFAFIVIESREVGAWMYDTDRTPW